MHTCAATEQYLPTIVKILGLDDSSLKDVPYYPYDMVHYKG